MSYCMHEIRQLLKYMDVCTYTVAGKVQRSIYIGLKKFNEGHTYVCNNSFFNSCYSISFLMNLAFLSNCHCIIVAIAHLRKYARIFCSYRVNCHPRACP